MEIADAALRILSEQGVQRLTAVELARAVGISDGAIFRHFRNKEEILAAAIDRYETLLFTGFPSEEPDPVQRLRAFFLQRIRVLQEQPAILHLAFTDRLSEAGSPAQQERLGTFVRRSLRFVMDCVVEAQENQQLRADVHPQLLVWMVVGVLRGLATSPFPEWRTLAPEQAWQELWRMLRGQA